MFRRQRNSLQWSWQMRGNLEICVEISVNQCQLISINATLHIGGCGEIGFHWPFTEHYLALKEHLHSKGEKVDQVSGQRL